MSLYSLTVAINAVKTSVTIELSAIQKGVANTLKFRNSWLSYNFSSTLPLFPSIVNFQDILNLNEIFSSIECFLKGYQQHE